jgi:hypothetical protein
MANVVYTFIDVISQLTSQVSSVSIVSGYGLVDLRSEFDPRLRQGIFPVTSESIPTLGSTQPPVQWVTCPFPGGKERPGREADHSPPFGVEVVNE